MSRPRCFRQPWFFFVANGCIAALPFMTFL
jgi:hypothetical protein